MAAFFKIVKEWGKYETFNYGYDGYSNFGIFNCMGCW